MEKAIVTTTIYPPSTATKLFAKKKGWHLIIVGDLKTPHDRYSIWETSPSVTYLHPKQQEELYSDLSKAIGWNTIQRRNIGLLYAYHMGANIIATVDDDNIPYEGWGENVYVNQTIEIDLYESPNGVFDPLAATKYGNFLWHRGYPIDLLNSRHEVQYKGKATRKVLVQADLWDGDPDIDAMARIVNQPVVRFDISTPFGASNISPFNSQNTFLSREVLPVYSVLPHVGRMDDIWGGYILQHYFPNSVVYAPASVYQDRNEQDLVTNLENEVIGYRNTFKLLKDLSNYSQYLPEKALNYWKIYRKYFEEK